MAKKTIKDYPKDWPAISEQIKIRDGWQCQKCGLQFSPDERKVIDSRGKDQVVTVHHKDRNTHNNSGDNLITLCGRCHCQEEWPLIRREREEKRGQLFFQW